MIKVFKDYNVTHMHIELHDIFIQDPYQHLVHLQPLIRSNSIAMVFMSNIQL
jgi:hypothetical protein